MAKKEEVPFITSGKFLFQNRATRDIIGLTISSDIGLGKGIPRGCTILLGGKYKSGKTTVALQWAANAQKLYNTKVFFFNIEGRLDNKVLAQIQGLNLDNMEIIMGPAILDKDGNVVGNKKLSSQAWWTEIGRVITENPGSFIIVDSIAAMSDESELAEGMGHFGRGSLQKLEAQFYRQYGDLVVPSKTTLVLLTQIQANTSGYGEAIQMKCGNAIKHMADAIIFIKGVKKWEENSKDKRVLGQDMNWKIECSTFGAPFIETNVPLRFGYGIDTPLDLLRNAITWDLVKLDGAWYTLPFIKDDNNFVYTEVSEDKKAFVRMQGEENARMFLVQNPKAMKLLDKAIREKLLI